MYETGSESVACGLYFSGEKKEGTYNNMPSKV